MSKITTILIIIIGVLIAGWFLVSRLSLSDSSKIVARSGLHWHATLNIKAAGEPVIIPGGIGLEGLTHNPMHTHDIDNVIHMEYNGLVKENDLKLGKFFEIWGRKFEEDRKMLVNGKENLEFENYIMRDSDKIEIIYGK